MILVKYTVTLHVLDDINMATRMAKRDEEVLPSKAVAISAGSQRVYWMGNWKMPPV